MSEQGVKYHFLLGGYDLEMLEIRQMLEACNEKFTDLHLAWGAKLSAYAGFFNEDEHFAGIELVEDVKPPKHYTYIDHHNENSHRPSAIEQVAELLGIELTRYQLLVAANDSGYIPEMEAMGASKTEILRIRQADRQAQGVNEEDEILAEMSIKENLNIYQNLIIVESLTPKFSAIADRLYPYKMLLVSFHNHFVCYGQGVETLISTYKNIIKQKKAYYGGKGINFFGLDKNAFSTEEAKLLKQQVIKLMTEK